MELLSLRIWDGLKEQEQRIRAYSDMSYGG